MGWVRTTQLISWSEQFAYPYVKGKPHALCKPDKGFSWNFKSDNRPRVFFSRMLKEKQPEYLAKSDFIQSYPPQVFFPESKLCAPFQLPSRKLWKEPCKLVLWMEGLQNPFFKMLLRGLCQTFIWKSSSKTLPQGTAPARWQLLRGWLQAAPAQVNFEIPHLEAATGQVAPVAWGIGCFACQFSFASNESLEVSWNHRKFDDLAQEVYLYIQYVFWFHLGMSYGIMMQKASLLIIPGPP